MTRLERPIMAEFVRVLTRWETFDRFEVCIQIVEVTIFASVCKLQHVVTI